MFSKVLSRSIVSVLGCVFVLSLCIGLQSANAKGGNDCNLYGCNNDCEFITDFLIEDCNFKTTGRNPYFILVPGYQLVLESDEERAVETVLPETYTIGLGDRKIKTRVVEERAFEWDDDENEWVTIEISLNYFAICKETNDVYYFGEFSRDCPDGFDEDDECDDESNDGSWEAGQPPMDDPAGVIARPGLIMLGTPLLGAKYFQEIAPPDAVDRGEIVAMGLTWPLEDDLGSGEEPDFTDCINIIDTNPAEGVCKESKGDSKIYCPGVGLVQDEDLKLVY